MHETLEKQFEQVKEETTTSHVVQWGETSIASQKVSRFLGNKQNQEDASIFGPFEADSDPCLVGGGCVCVWGGRIGLRGRKETRGRFHSEFISTQTKHQTTERTCNEFKC